MFSFSFRNRIAFNYILSTAILILFVFFGIYQITSFSINKHINDDILEESKEYIELIQIEINNSFWIKKNEWRERDNNAVKVNPVYVQFFDYNNKLIDKSPNLKGFELRLFKKNNDNQFVDSFLNEQPIRQIQIPILNKGKKVGYVFVAMSLDEATLILTNLRNTLYIVFPLILIVLFLIARFIVGRSIKPIKIITQTSSKITKDNLKERIDLPQNKDELFVLSKTINDLLDRIENAVEREKQFTSDASHELRTPLTVLKGTLEVLIRKPRTQQEYEDKIKYGISEVNRLNNLVDQLLLLARFENQIQSVKTEKVYLNALILDILTRYSTKINTKKISINHSFSEEYFVSSDNYLVAVILGNIISNAIKYSSEKGTITIMLSKNENTTICRVSDNGMGIAKEDLVKILNPFYRSNPTQHPDIKGSGLGLSIVRRVTEILAIKMEIQSEINKGTSVILSFK